MSSATKCAGSGTFANALQGDDEVCPICQKWVKTTRAGNFYAHKATARKKDTLRVRVTLTTRRGRLTRGR